MAPILPILRYGVWNRLNMFFNTSRPVSEVPHTLDLGVLVGVGVFAFEVTTIKSCKNNKLVNKFIVCISLPGFNNIISCVRSEFCVHCSIMTLMWLSPNFRIIIRIIIIRVVILLWVETRGVAPRRNPQGYNYSYTIGSDTPTIHQQDWYVTYTSRTDLCCYIPVWSINPPGAPVTSSQWFWQGRWDSTSRLGPRFFVLCTIVGVSLPMVI